MPRSRRRRLPAIFVAFLALAGCQRDRETPSAGSPAKQEAAPPADAPKSAAGTPLGQTITRAGTRPSSARLVIYKAELGVEVRAPGDAQAKITSLVEREGGFVASAAREGSEGRAADVTLVVRVPAARFSAVLAEIRRLGDGRRSERIDSEDVTDEHVDLEARLRVQTRLEEQLLELLKTATTVEAALNVHKELAVVRTEIERIQGRKELLERELALSTIKITLSAPPVENVSFAKVGQSFSLAYSDAILVAGGIVMTTIRLVGILVPVAVLFGIPLLLVVVAVRRRMRARTDLASAEPS